MKRVISLIFALLMVFTMLPIGAIAANAETPYHHYTDFTTATPDNGSSGNITANLPTGWVANDDPDIVPNFKKWPTTINYDWAENPHNIEDGIYYDQQKIVGVRLGGQNQGIAMTDAAGIPADILNGTIDHTITVKWNTTHKFAIIHFGWSDGTVPTKNSVITGQDIAFNYTGGPSNVGTVNEAFGDGIDKGGNFMFNETYAYDRRDENGNQVDHAYIDEAHHTGVASGAQVTTTIEVVSGAVSAVHNTISGVTVTYLASNYVAANGYFSIWITNWGDNNTVNIQSVEINEGIVGTPPSGDPAFDDAFPTVYNERELTYVDFKIIRNDTQLAETGFVWNSVTPENEGWVPHIEYTNDGLAIKGGTGDFLVNTGVVLDNDSTYIIDYTFKMNPSVWIFLTEFGFTPDMFEGDDHTVNAALSAHHTYADVSCAFKQRGNESGKMLCVDGYNYYIGTLNCGLYNPSQEAVEAACGDEKTPIRVRILVSEGTSSLAFMTIGNEHFSLKRSVEMEQGSVAGLVGFTFVGTSREARGVTLQNFSITKCDLEDTSGGNNDNNDNDNNDAAIDEIQKNLDDAIEELEKAIAAGDKKLDEKISKLNDALKAAEKAYIEAAGELTEELESLIYEAGELLGEAIGSLQENLDKAEAELDKKITDGDKALDAKISELKKAEEERAKAAAEREKALTDQITVLENDLRISNYISTISQFILGSLAVIAIAGDVLLLILFFIKRKKA